MHIKIEHIDIGPLKLNEIPPPRLSHVSEVYGSFLFLLILLFINYRKGEIAFMERKVLSKTHISEKH